VPCLAAAEPGGVVRYGPDNWAGGIVRKGIAEEMSRQVEREARRSRRAERRLAAERAARRRRQMSIFGGLVAVALIAALVLILINRPGAGEDISDIAAAAPLDAGIPTNGRVMGQEGAPVHVVEWGDYQCPGCGYFNRNMKSQLIAEYVATGKITFEYRDWAFLGPDSIRAAQAAFCAEDQGKFWQYHDTLFMNQRAENQGDFSATRLKEMARQVGLDMEAFNQCYDNETFKDEVEASYNEGKQAGLTGTPSFMINGQLLQGWNGRYETLKAAIDQALAQ